MNLRQIDLDEWVKGDYRFLSQMNIEISDLAKKFRIEFEEIWEDGLGDAKIAFFLLNDKIQFFIEGFPFNQAVQTYIGCLNNPETQARDLDNILEALELTSKDIIFLYEDIKFHPHQLWRQDDNGHKFLIETFPCKADAVRAMKEFEAKLHKQTYWVQKT